MEIARRLGLTGAAVRQHLATLAAEGLVLRRRGEGSKGRPRFLYRLSERGRRAYPKRYDLLLDELIGVLIERQGPAAVLESVAAAGGRLGRRIAPALGDDPLERRRAAIAWLEDTLGWESTEEASSPGGTTLVVHRCPFQDVAPDRASVCGAFVASLVAALLDVPSVRHVPLGEDVRCCALEIAGEAAPAGESGE